MLQLPGFGCELPTGFVADMESYADWLRAQLAAIDSPIDLVTHDWGALLAVPVLADDPGVRSWVTDGSNLDADFKWHDTARAWQTPEVGEAFMDGMLGADESARAELLETSGAPPAAAAIMAAGLDDTMAAAILELYRSAVDIGVRWGPAIDRIDVQSLVLDAQLDAFISAHSQAVLARRLGADLVTLEGQGHWWMVGDPANAALAIDSFWSKLRE